MIREIEEQGVVTDNAADDGQFAALGFEEFQGAGDEKEKAFNNKIRLEETANGRNGLQIFRQGKYIEQDFKKIEIGPKHKLF